MAPDSGKKVVAPFGADPQHVADCIRTERTDSVRFDEFGKPGDNVAEVVEERE
ncbi:unannotated protein [freshwater metagenome]|uniref:Unannotated protein n=1 Tax=freshwater metagenome TaxID=449393 RepID=A0A6J6H929_9ZZZZ